MELRHLRYFLAVADCGSLTRAADIVHVTQPALSRQIKDLEDELSVRLLVRNSNGVTLTEAGMVFRTHCVKILKQAESAVRDVAAQSTNATPLLRIGFDQLSGGTHLIKALHALGTRASNVSVNIAELSDKAILQHLFAETLDVGLWTGGLNWLPPEFDSVSIVKRDVCVLLADDNRFTRDAPFKFEELSTLPLIVLGDVGKSQHHDFAMDFMRRMAIPPSSTIHAPNHMVMYSLIAARRGFSIVPEDPTLDVFEGALSRFRLPLNHDSTQTYAIWPKKTTLLARELFVQILHEFVEPSEPDPARPVYSGVDGF